MGIEHHNRDEVWAELIEKTRHLADIPQLYFDPEHSPYPPGLRAWAACVLAARERLESTVQRFHDDDEARDDLARFPSTLSPIEDYYGGFFGVTSLIAEPGIGKTMLALASALTAAATQKWNVVYLCGELDVGEMIERRAREMTAHTTAIDGADYLTMVQVGTGQTILDFCVQLAECDHELPILVVMDSINTLATLSRGDYLRTLENFAIWAMMSRRLSRGAASFLLVSETNKAGNSKGEKLEFWSDLAIGMKGKKNEPLVDFSIKKIRRGEWRSLPRMHRHWDTNRFYTESELRQLTQPRLVASGGETLLF